MTLSDGLSILALTVSIPSAIFTWRATRDNRKLIKIEEARHHTESTPKFEIRVEEVSEWFRMWIRLTSSEELDGLTAEITSPADVYFAPEQTGVEIGIGPTKRATWGKVPISKEHVAWRITFDDGDEREGVMVLTAVIGSRVWMIEQKFTLPSKYDIFDSVIL